MRGVRFAVSLVIIGWMGLGNISFVHAAGERVVRLYAAGSLRAALTEVIAAFEKAQSVKVEPTFGASGLLRERLASGEQGDLFASADVGQPLALQSAGKAGPVVLFARNRLCALVRPNLAVTSETLLTTMLDPTVRLGTSTPKADPSGDYAWEVFRRAEAVRPGSRERLEAKVIKLTGDPAMPQPPPDRNVYAWHVAENRADLFLGYCTNAKAFKNELPDGRVVELPPELSIGAEYGLTVLEAAAAPRTAAALALYILSNDGQRVLHEHGFDAPLLGKEWIAGEVARVR
jgi:molybdate transport system substrate-binding protein